MTANMTIWILLALNATQTPEENEIQGPGFLAAMNKLESAWHKSKESYER